MLSCYDNEEDNDYYYYYYYYYCFTIWICQVLC